MNDNEIVIKNEVEYKNLIAIAYTVVALLVSLSMAKQNKPLGPGYNFHLDQFIFRFICFEIPILFYMITLKIEIPANSETKIEVHTDENLVSLKYNDCILELVRGEMFSISYYSGYKGLFRQATIENSLGHKLEFLTIKSHSYVTQAIIEGLGTETKLISSDTERYSKRKNYMLENSGVNSN